jgi:outer membrane protein assembly factor BamE (lipoprotein component of BamABCDE complex)
MGVAAVGLFLGACSPRVSTHGNLPDPDKIAELAPGKQNRQQVQQLLGSPSSVTAFGGETWVYVSHRTETIAFLKTETNDRKVLVVRFDKKGVVEAVETLGLEHARKLDPVDRVTPTTGNEMTVLEQMLGNFGRFAKKEEKQQDPSSR